MGFTPIAGAPTSAAETSQTQKDGQSQIPNIETIFIRYGIITKVTKNNFVKVVLLNKDGNPEGNEIASGKALSVNTALSTILLLFGPLRPGLLCRVTWKGDIEPSSKASIDIVGDEEHSFLKKEPYPTQINIGPWKIFAGGMLG